MTEIVVYEVVPTRDPVDPEGFPPGLLVGRFPSYAAARGAVRRLCRTVVSDRRPGQPDDPASEVAFLIARSDPRDRQLLSFHVCGR